MNQRSCRGEVNHLLQSLHGNKWKGFTSKEDFTVVYTESENEVGKTNMQIRDERDERRTTGGEGSHLKKF